MHSSSICILFISTSARSQLLLQPWLQASQLNPFNHILSASPLPLILLLLLPHLLPPPPPPISSSSSSSPYTASMAAIRHVLTDVVVELILDFVFFFFFFLEWRRLRILFSSLSHLDHLSVLCHLIVLSFCLVTFDYCFFLSSAIPLFLVQAIFFCPSRGTICALFMPFCWWDNACRL